MKYPATPSFRAGLCLLTGLFPISIRAQQPDQPAGWFVPHPAWTQVENVASTADGSLLLAAIGRNGPILFINAAKPGLPHLRTEASVGDCIISLEYMLRADTRAALYLHAGYRLQLDGAEAGTLGVMVGGDRRPLPVSSVPPRHPAASQPGAWQKLEARLRAPRFHESGVKSEDALILEVKINGVVVQSNTLADGWCLGAESGRESSDAPTSLAVERGSMAIREFSLLRADFDAIKLPAASGQPTNATDLVDDVQQGAGLFRSLGCIECHATQRDDTTPKAGPNQFGLFQFVPRDREITAGDGRRATIKADRSYLQRSLRTPLDELAIAERGPTQGQPYPPAMLAFLPTMLSDAQIDALGAYLATLNDPPNQGPVIRLVPPANHDNPTP